MDLGQFDSYAYRNIRNYLSVTIVVLSLIYSHQTLHQTRPPPQPLIRIANASCSRQYNRCTHEEIPLVSGYLETAEHLLNHPEMSFVRFGDGEIELMNGISKPFQTYDERLGKELYRVFTSNHPRLSIGLPDIFSGFPPLCKKEVDYWDAHKTYREWMIKHSNKTKPYLNSKITSLSIAARPYCALIPHTYNVLRKIWMNKDVVLLRGDNNQTYTYDIYDTARSVKVIYAARFQAWNEYSSLKSALLNEKKRNLYILTAGPVSKVLTLDLTEAGRRALDLGHLAKDYDVFMGNKSTYGFYQD